MGRGAILASSPAMAIAASPVALICVYDYIAAEAILAVEAVAVAVALAGKLVANLGTGSPEDAGKAQNFIHGHGGRYLDGAIQAAPSQMGEDNTPILVSGAQATYDEVYPLLRILGGGIVYLGEKIEAAAFMDLATLSFDYGAFAGFLHGARLAETVGIDVGTYGSVVNEMSPSFGAFFKHEGAVIQSGDFTITESPMRISVAAMDRILGASKDLGVNAELPALVGGWLSRADAAGLAGQELAALIKVLRQLQVS